MPLDAILVRDATAADIGPITAIYRHEVENGIASFEEAAPSEEEMTGRMAKVVALGLPYLAAESRTGDLLGYCYAGPFHARAAYRYTVEDSVYIAPSARGRGVGRALLKALIARCEATGCRQMMALITWSESSASITLHEKIGFRSMGIAQAVGYKFGRWIDVAYMQLTIGGGRATPPDRPAPGLPFAA